MSDLKVCPFCGGEASMGSEYDMDGFGRFHWIECKKCRARSASHFVSQGNECPHNIEEVRESWNNRPRERKLKAAYERLDIAVEALQKIAMRTRLLAGSGAVASAALEKIKSLGVENE